MLYRSKVIDIFYFSLIISLVLIFFNVHSLNVNSTWILYCAKEMLTGAVLYVDRIDINPPLIFIYSLIPAFFSNIFNISVGLIYIIFIFFITAISLLLIYTLLNNSIYKKNIRPIIYSLTFILTISVSYNFGDREHLFIIFILPYTLLQIIPNSIKGKKLLLFALFAVLGFNLKPHFFLIFLTIILIKLFQTKRLITLFRVDFLIISFSALIYLLIIKTFFPEYIDEIVPLTLNSYYLIESLQHLSFKVEILFFILSVLLVLFIQKFKLSKEQLFLLIFAYIAFIIYILQGKSFSYQLIPFFVFSQCFMLFSFINLKEKEKLYFFFLTPLYIYLLFYNCYEVPKYKQITNLIKTKEKKSVYLFSVDIAMGKSFFNSNYTWASRFPSLFMLSKMAIYKDKALEKKILDILYDDLIKYQPDILIFPTKRFNYYQYFYKKSDKLRVLFLENYKFEKKMSYIILNKL